MNHINIGEKEREMRKHVNVIMKKIIAVGCMAAMVMSSSAFSVSASIITEAEKNDESLVVEEIAEEVYVEDAILEADVLEAENTEVNEDSADDEVEAENYAEGKPTIWFVGDSTVCNYVKEDGTHTDNTYYYPRYGYGTQLENYLDGSFEINNIAMSGRSSKTFMSETNYSTLKNGIKSGDVLIIGFGHNDEKFEDDRYADPNADVNTEGSFQNVLYNSYVKLATDKGATPILCTPMVRYDNTNNYTGDKIHNTTGKSGTVNGKTVQGGDYAKAIKDLGTAKAVAVVDLTTLTKNEWSTLGVDEAKYLHAWTNSKDTSVDATHPNIFGGKMIAYLLANSIKEQNIAPVAAHVDLSKAKPTKANDLVANPNYVEKSYTRPEDGAKVSIANDYTIGKATFHPTVFGDVGGASKVTSDNFNFKNDADGNMRISCANYGKIAAASDGLAMYYYRIPATSIFTLKADAKVNTLYTGNSQGFFGLMARDDMYIGADASVTVNSNYVVAGSLSSDKEPYGCNCFYRKDGALGGKAKLSSNLKAGNTYSLEITSNPDGFACKFGDEPVQTGGYDFALTGVDSEYIYVGMAANRGMDITFSNISLIVDGVNVITGEKEGGTEPEKEYTIDVDTKLTGGSIKLDKKKAVAGQTVEFEVLADKGYDLESVSITSEKKPVDYRYAGNMYNFKMPSGDVFITASFKKQPIESDSEFVADFRYSSNVIYSGMAITPEVVVEYDGTELSEGIDYTLAYKNNVNAYEYKKGDALFNEKKAPQVIITAKGSYSGKAILTFTIEKKDLSKLAEIQEPIVVGAGMKLPTISVFSNYGVVKASEYEYNKNETFNEDGELTVTAKSSGNYKESVKIPVKVLENDKVVKITAATLAFTYYDLSSGNKKVTGATIPYLGDTDSARIFIGNQLISSETGFAGEAISKVNGGSVSNENVKVIVPDECLSIGKHSVVICGAGYNKEEDKYYTGSVVKTYTVKADKNAILNVSYDKEFAVKDGFSYSLNPNGVNANPGVLNIVVSASSSAGYIADDKENVYAPISEGAVLEAGRDYDVTYSNNKAVSYDSDGKVAAKAQFNFKFKNGYAGVKVSATTLVNGEKQDSVPVFNYKIIPMILDEYDIVTLDKTAAKVSVVKSAPYVVKNFCLVPTSQYTVKYYVDSECKPEDELSKNNVDRTVSKDDPTVQTIYVKVMAKDKANIKGTAIGSYCVKSDVNAALDITKAKIKTEKSATKEYSGTTIMLDDNDFSITLGGATKSNDNFDFTYINNIYKGKAIVVVNGSSKSEEKLYGSKIFNFNITQYKVK